ncbi:MAG: ABC transporter permease [Oscillospiraceae bacterium]|nr:ABC transporter permease [Oscillospiraceae bacterium]
MRFGNMLKKELSQLLTKQAIISMLLTCGLLMMLGKVMGSTMKDITSNNTINVVCLDDSEFAADMLNSLSDYGSDVKKIDMPGFTSDNAAQVLTDNDIKAFVVIPADFSEKAENGKQAEVQVYTHLNGTGLSGMLDDSFAADCVTSINNYLRDHAEKNVLNLTDEQSDLIAEPMLMAEFTTANGRTAKAPASALSGILMSINMIAPMAVFFLLFMASSMIMTAISTEKIDKTLETLLSSPVSRVTVLTAKMTAAVIVALLNSLTMMIGFAFYIGGMAAAGASAVSGAPAPDPSEVDLSKVTDVFTAMSQLGITLSVGQILLVGLELFITLAIGLSAALILGAFATDAQSTSTLIMPLMFLTMIPFMITMFADVNSMPLFAKIVLYLIPFTHAYTAIGNLMFGHHLTFWLGMAYQLLFLAASLFIAVKIFTSDLLFTMKLPTSGAKNQNTQN